MVSKDVGTSTCSQKRKVSAVFVCTVSRLVPNLGGQQLPQHFVPSHVVVPELMRRQGESTEHVTVTACLYGVLLYDAAATGSGHCRRDRRVAAGGGRLWQIRELRQRRLICSR
jgi:hypothetical protein